MRLSLCAAFLALAGESRAAGLFLPVDPAGAADVAPAAKSATARHSTSEAPDAWERRVRVARDDLTRAREDVENAGAGRLLLNVRDGVHLDVAVERTAPTKLGYSLSGRVVAGNGGFATLAVHEEAVAASIWTPDSAYELSYLGGGIHALRDVTNAPAIECGGGPPADFSADDATARSGADDDSVVDILVVWTPSAEELHGGEPHVLSRIDLLIADTNDAFERSGAFVSLRLAGAEKVDYVEVDSATDLTRLWTPDDSHMDRVHGRRNALGADLIYLLTARGGGRAAGAFGVGGTAAFGHEVGHNFGIGHERYEQRYIGLLPYAHGFSTRSCRKTIMSYGDGCRRRYNIPFYASPWRYSPVDGSALGVTRFSNVRGVRGPADAVLTLNRNRHRIANFRPGRSK